MSPRAIVGPRPDKPFLALPARARLRTLLRLPHRSFSDVEMKAAKGQPSTLGKLRFANRCSKVSEDTACHLVSEIYISIRAPPR